MPYLAGSFAYVISNLFMFKRSLSKRFFLSMFVGSFALSTSHYVGQYGLQRNIDDIFAKIILDAHIKRGSQVAIDAKKFNDELTQPQK